jgi:hypothetical protein
VSARGKGALRLGHAEPTAARRITVARKQDTGVRGLTVVPDVMGVLDRAVQLTASIGALEADNECEHGGLPCDGHAQPGCTPGCPGYPRGLAAPAPAPVATVRRKRTPPPSNGRVIGRERNDSGELLQRILCACGRKWARPAGKRGRVPSCPTCRGD